MGARLRRWPMMVFDQKSEVDKIRAVRVHQADQIRRSENSAHGSDLLCTRGELVCLLSGKVSKVTGHKIKMGGYLHSIMQERRVPGKRDGGVAQIVENGSAAICGPQATVTKHTGQCVSILEQEAPHGKIPHDQTAKFVSRLRRSRQLMGGEHRPRTFKLRLYDLAGVVP